MFKFSNYYASPACISATPDTVLYILFSQVIESSDEYIDDIQSIAGDDSNLHSLTGIFGTWLSKHGLTYLVLDGLDEFHYPPKVFQTLERRQHALSTANLRLLISSGPSPLIYNKLRDGDTERIDVMAHNVDDTDRYVSERLSEPPSDHGLLIQDDVEKSRELIRHNSGGM